MMLASGHNNTFAYYYFYFTDDIEDGRQMCLGAIGR